MDKRSKSTEERLHKAVIELLVEHPYKDISINDICEKADIKRPTFYNHYKNKDDFMQKAVYNHFKKIIEEARLPDNISFKVYFLTVLEGYLKLIEEYRDKTPALSQREDYRELTILLTYTSGRVFDEKLRSLYPDEQNKTLLQTYSDIHVGIFVSITTKFIKDKQSKLDTLIEDLNKVFITFTIEKDFKR